MEWRWLRALGFALFVVPASAPAQGRPPVEVGGFLRWDVFDANLGMDDYFAAGGRAGVAVFPMFAVELDISRVSTNGGPGIPVTNSSVHLRALHDRPLAGRVAALVGLGVVHNDYGASRSGSENGLSALAGVRIPITELVAVRLDLTADYLPAPANAGSHNWNYGIAQGLSLTFGGRKRSPTPVATEVERPQPPPPPTASAPAPPPPAPAPLPPPPAPAPEFDGDGDGVVDRLDRCPGTAVGVPVDARGCPRDSDGDGVTDTFDRCGDTAPGTPVNEFGCPRDSDGDGITDGSDRCPATPPGTLVDANGCLRLFEEGRASLVLEGVHFAHNKAELTPDSRRILDDVAASLRANPAVRVMIEGHTSLVGSREINLRLSRARAHSVRDYLAGQGVAAHRLEAEGFGPDRPVASNDTEDGQARNRRVELRELRS